MYICDRGSDRIWSFRLDAANGALEPTEPPAGRTPPETGPRHAVNAGARIECVGFDPAKYEAKVSLSAKDVVLRVRKL